MRIDDDHMYHGAALIQIAEAPQFTAINSLKLASGVSRNAYRINDDTGVYLKYASTPKPPHDEYQFTFRQQHLEELCEIYEATDRLFIALVCVKLREICLLSYADLQALIDARRRKRQALEDQYTVLVTAPSRRPFQVYVNAPVLRSGISLDT